MESKIYRDEKQRNVAFAPIKGKSRNQYSHYDRGPFIPDWVVDWQM